MIGREFNQISRTRIESHRSRSGFCKTKLNLRASQLLQRHSDDVASSLAERNYRLMQPDRRVMQYVQDDKLPDNFLRKDRAG